MYKYTGIKLNCAPTAFSQVGGLCDTKGIFVGHPRLQVYEYVVRYAKTSWYKPGQASASFSPSSAYAELLIACGCMDGKWGVYLDPPVKNG